MTIYIPIVEANQMVATVDAANCSNVDMSMNANRLAVYLFQSTPLTYFREFIAELSKLTMDSYSQSSSWNGDLTVPIEEEIFGRNTTKRKMILD